MISSIFILVFSAILFVYWFRYTCVLMLQSKTAQDYSARVVEANQLSYPSVEFRLSEADWDRDLGELVSSLKRDYRLLSYLLKHAAGLEVGGSTLEQRMLMIDFRIMQSWCKASRYFSPALSRAALREMAQVLHNFANTMGERVACTTD
jgi:hypothetical protein